MTSPENAKIDKLFYIGLFILSFCLLASEVLLTRILSVILWYHFAFLVISVVLLGMTAGALIIYYLPKRFPSFSTQRHIGIYAYVSSFAILISLFCLFYLPAIFAFLDIEKLLMPILYFVLSLPFITFGICLSLSLSRFPEHVGKIYSVNLIGSALGCIGIIFLLNNLNAPSVILFISALCALSALFFSFKGRLHSLFKTCCIVTLVFCLFFSFVNNISNAIRPLWVKGMIQRMPPLYSKWNFFSYISVGFPSRRPFGWGFSPKVTSARVDTNELMILIDNGAGTVLTEFNTLSDLEYLKLDVSAAAYYLGRNDDVLVLGSGGGRDLLTAVLFGAKKAVGIEINQDINDIAFNKLSDFSGSITQYRQIELEVDEGRSFISKSEEKYDIIQASLVDSWAAFANGAFSLTENSLYTKEAWLIFLRHLKERGILTFSRWYERNNPKEIYKLILLAKNALQEASVANVRQNIVLIRSISPDNDLGVGTILVSNSPFSDSDLALLENMCEELAFELVLSPKKSTDDNFISILEGSTSEYPLKNSSFTISLPTDNRPFFFYFGKFMDIFSKNPAEQGVRVLRQLFLMIFIFAIVFIMLPLRHAQNNRTISMSMIVYFASIGLGFMFVEISFMQRLGLFLGHPIYGLTVVLFSLLSSCGIGSFLTKYLTKKTQFLLPFAGVALFGFIFLKSLPFIIHMATPSPVYIKILVSIAVLVLMGIFMGMPFPLGMALSHDEKNARVLYWGVNGFASVCGSALAAVLLINFGFQQTLFVGICCYIIASLSLFSCAKAMKTPQ